MGSFSVRQCICGNSVSFTKIFHYKAPPKGEIVFDFSSKLKYDREIVQCTICNHFLSWHDMDMSSLYSSDYVSSTYGTEGIKKTYDKINALPIERSDNMGRVNTIVNFSKKYFSNLISKPSILDVGSGLCVFLYRMKQEGWECTALDPDARTVEHAKATVGVNAIQADFFQLSKQIEKFNVISFNKVLEHVKDPVFMLKHAKQYLADSGFIYIELPDGEMAAKDGEGREEFFIDHIHVFSASSLALLVQKAGYKLMHFERLQEPSTKYTLRAFIKP